MRCAAGGAAHPLSSSVQLVLLYSVELVLRVRDDDSSTSSRSSGGAALSLTFEVTHETGSTSGGAGCFEDAFLQGGVARNTRGSIAHDDGERIHKVDAMSGGKTLHLHGDAVAQPAVAHPLPTGVPRRRAAIGGRAQLAIDGAPLVLERVINRLVEGLICEAHIVRIRHAYEPAVLLGFEQVTGGAHAEGRGEGEFVTVRWRWMGAG